MTEAHILALGTAVPEARYDQAGLFREHVKPYFRQNRHVETIFQNVGIRTRYLAAPPDFYRVERGTQARNEAYLVIAQELGKTAIERCLGSAGLDPQAVDDLIVISCTGIDTPGLDLLLAGKLGMRSDLKRSTILGMGCYAALPGLSRARESVLARKGRRTLVLAVEICSLHFQPEDASTENAVCTALFGDGAAAVLVESGDVHKAEEQGTQTNGGPQLVDFATHCDYQTLDQMAFHLTDHGFQMALSSYVPAILGAKVEDFVDGLLGRNGLRRGDIRVWAAHPGSAKILDYTRERLDLPGSALDCSYAVLQDFGNMSSPTILFILERLQKERVPQAGDYGVLLAFGPGLTIEGALVRW